MRCEFPEQPTPSFSPLGTKHSEPPPQAPRKKPKKRALRRASRSARAAPSLPITLAAALPSPQTWGQKSQEGDVSVPEHSSVAARAHNITLRLTKALPDFRSYYVQVCAPPGLRVAKASPFAKGWVFIPHVFP